MREKITKYFPLLSLVWPYLFFLLLYLFGGYFLGTSTILTVMVYIYLLVFLWG